MNLNCYFIGVKHLELHFMEKRCWISILWLTVVKLIWTCKFYWDGKKAHFYFIFIFFLKWAKSQHCFWTLKMFRYWSIFSSIKNTFKRKVAFITLAWSNQFQKKQTQPSIVENDIYVPVVHFSPEEELKQLPWSPREERDDGCSSEHSGIFASSW